MRQCPQPTATGAPLVWNDYAVFLDIADWTRIKKLEGTLVRDLGGVVEKELATLKAEMVGPLNVRLLRDESGNVRPGTARAEGRLHARRPSWRPPDPAEMTVRVGKPAAPSLTDLPTERVPAMAAPTARACAWQWDGGLDHRCRAGTRVGVRPAAPAALPRASCPLTGAGSKINKRQLWIEAGRRRRHHRPLLGGQPGGGGRPARPAGRPDRRGQFPRAGDALQRGDEAHDRPR